MYWASDVKYFNIYFGCIVIKIQYIFINVNTFKRTHPKNSTIQNTNINISHLTFLTLVPNLCILDTDKYLLRQ